jgi:hypothetical protein
MSQEFCTGVKILLSRMESNPEEFTETYSNRKNIGRWNTIIQGITTAKLGSSSKHDTLTVEEVDALYDALVNVRRKRFDEAIMQELLKDEFEAELSSSITKGQKNFNLASVQTSNASITVHNGAFTK